MPAPMRQKTEHEKAIDVLIPQASKEAMWLVKRMGRRFENRRGVDGKHRLHDYFTEFFHAKMNELAAKKGLRPNLNI